MGRVVVVGAGISGLVATYELRKRGLEVVTLEKLDKAGGRTVRQEENGYTIDIGTQFVARYYKASIGLINELGLGSEVVRSPVRIRMWRDRELYPLGISLDPRSLYGSIKYFASYSLKDMAGLAKMMVYSLRRWSDFNIENLQYDLDGLSSADIIMSRAGENMLEGFFQPGLTGMNLEEPEQIGATLGMVNLKLIMRSFISGLITLRNGFGSITERLQDKCGGCIRLSTAADRIVIEDGTVKGVSSGNNFIDAESVVCATTATAALGLMPDLPQPIAIPLSKARYSSCCHVVFAVDNHPFIKGELGIELPRKTGSPLASILSGRAMCQGFAPPGGDLVHCFTWGKQARELNGLPDDQVIDSVKWEARKYLPTLPDKPVFSKIYRLGEAVFTLPPGSFRQLNSVSDRCSGSVKGLYLAGEHLVIGGVESGIMSGTEAAKMVLRDMS